MTVPDARGMSTTPWDFLGHARRSRWTLPLAVMAALLILGVNELAYRQSAASLTTISQRSAARYAIQQVWRSLVDAESGQRAYLLTGRADHMSSYERAAGEANHALQALQHHYRGDAEAQPLLADLARATDGKLSELGTTLQLYDAEHANPRNWRELLLTDIGREQMDSLRDASRRLLALETGRVAAGRRGIDATLRNGHYGVITLATLTLLALLLFRRQARAIRRAQDTHALQVQDERARLETEVSHRTADLSALARHLQDAHEAERSRLARELHDELGALLTAARLDAAHLPHLAGPLPPDTQALLSKLNASIQQGIHFKRRIIEELRPSSLSTLGLAPTLENLLREQAARAGLMPTADLAPVALADSTQTTVYRLVQEALANVQRHAMAHEVSVLLREQTRHGRPGVRVAVRDDGVGFDPATQRGTAHGLMGMRYRVQAEGGHLDVMSSPGQGCLVTAWLPRQPPPPQSWTHEPHHPQLA